MYLLIQNILLLLCLTYSAQVMAIYIENDILIIDSQEDFIARSFMNDGNNQNLYTISMYKIDKPGRKEEAQLIESGEVMYAPLRMVVGPNKMDYFKVYYQGPEDDQERYYRIILKEVPTTLGKREIAEKESKYSRNVTSVALDTYVVIRPRVLRLQYDYQPDTGRLTNTGNTFIRLLLHKGCEDDNDPFVYDILPNEVLKHPLLKPQNRKFIVNNNQYIPLESQCILK